jgi:hypothetical protein
MPRSGTSSGPAPGRHRRRPDEQPPSAPARDAPPCLDRRSRMARSTYSTIPICPLTAAAEVVVVLPERAAAAVAMLCPPSLEASREPEIPPSGSRGGRQPLHPAQEEMKECGTRSAPGRVLANIASSIDLSFSLLISPSYMDAYRGLNGTHCGSNLGPMESRT